MNYLLPERLDALARAYALGTLSPRAERRFAQTVANSAAAAQAVARWREMLGTLELGAPATLAPSEDVWTNVQSRLFERRPAKQVEPARLPAGSRTPARGSAGVGRFAWPGLLGLAAGLLLFGAVLQWRPGALDMERASAGAPASYVGVLLDGQGHPLLSTIARRHGKVLTVRLLQPTSLPPEQTLTVWAWSDADPTPRPIGHWSQPNGTSDIALPAEAEALLSKMNHLGLTKEAAAAPPASPNLPFLAQGACAKVW
jgi:anti-sigma-K factor RskA